MHNRPCVLSFALESTGSSMPAKIAMMAITTSSSIRVNPNLPRDIGGAGTSEADLFIQCMTSAASAKRVPAAKFAVRVMEQPQVQRPDPAIVPLPHPLETECGLIL